MLESKRNNNMCKKFLCFMFILIILSACTISNDKPPEINTPIPENHLGTYISEDITFIFVGNGETVSVEFSERYLDLLESPPNNTDYTYTFTWYDFGEYRYDGATNLILYHTDTKTSINFSLDDSTSYEMISINFPIPDDEAQVLKRVSN